MKQASLSILSWNLENVHQRAEAEAELGKERDRQKGERGSWSHLSSVSSEDVPLCVTHVHWFQSLFPLQSCQYSNKEVVLKLFWSCLWLPCPVLVCPQPLVSSWWDLQSFPESFLFSFIPSSFQKQKSWCLVLNISISVYRYTFVFTVGKRWPLQQNLILSLFVNVH